MIRTVLIYSRHDCGGVVRRSKQLFKTQGAGPVIPRDDFSVIIPYSNVDLVTVKNIKIC